MITKQLSLEQALSLDSRSIVNNPENLVIRRVWRDYHMKSFLRDNNVSDSPNMFFPQSNDVLGITISHKYCPFPFMGVSLELKQSIWAAPGWWLVNHSIFVVVGYSMDR